MLFDMSPIVSPDNKPNVCMGNMEFSPYHPLRESIKGHFAYLNNIFFGKFCSIFHIGRAFPAIGSSFFNFIQIIIQGGSKEKVTWIYTFWIVAFMKNPKSIWNLPIGKFPRNPMGTHHCIVMPYLPITSRFEECKFPFPTFVRRFYINIIPEMFFKINNFFHDIFLFCGNEYIMDGLE